MGCLLCLWPCNRLVAGHPLLLVYISLDQARIDRERFAPNQPGRNAHCHDSLKDPTQGVTLPEAFVPRTTEYRVIGDPVVNAELAEPPVGQVDLDLSAPSASSAPGQSRACPCANNKAPTPCAPSLDRENRRTA